MGLDPKQIIEIRSLIKELGKEHTVIVSSHILSEINQICDKVIIINNGEIVAIDTPKNLEEKTKEQNILYLTVEDVNNRMSTIKEKITDIEEINLVKDNEDGTKQYKITSDSSKDIRKLLFETLPKEQITIFELKKEEVSLEDAFIRLTEGEKNKTEKENIEEKQLTSEENISKEEVGKSNEIIQNNETEKGGNK